MDTKDLTWKDLGDLFPKMTLSTRYDADDYDSGERSQTSLSVTYERLHCMTFTGFESQTVRYGCAHGRVTVYAEALAEGFDRDLGVRVALTLHGWGINCDCFRPDWRIHFGEEVNGRRLAAALRWVTDLRGSDLFTAFRFTWEARQPVDKTYKFPARRTRRPAA